MVSIIRYHILLSFIFTGFTHVGKAQEPALVQANASALAAGITLNEWKYQEGDNPDWAQLDYDDTDWGTIQISEPLSKTDVGYSAKFWLRAKVNIDHLNEVDFFALLIRQFGASEIYINGRLVRSLGTVASQGGHKSYNPHNLPIPVRLEHGENIVAIRFAADLPSTDWARSRTDVPLISVNLQHLENALNNREARDKISRLAVGFGFVCGVLSLLFLLFFLFSRYQVIYLFFSLFNLFLLLIRLVTGYLESDQYDLVERAYLISGTTLLSRLVGMNILLFMLHALNRMKTVFWWYAAFMIFVDFPLTILLPVEYMFVSAAFRSVIIVICLWLTYHAFTSEDKLNWLVGIIACSVILVNGSFSLQQYFGIDITGYTTGIVAPILTTLAIAVYLSLRYSRVNRNLEFQLEQVRELSEENLKKEHEKQQILATQAQQLEKQVHERTLELHKQKMELQTTLTELKSTQSQLIQSEKMASLGELTAGIAHEIQNPLNFVNNFSEVNKELIRDLKSEIQKGNIEEVNTIADDIESNEEKINHHGKRADSIVKSMLQHSRISSGKKEVTDINALCDEYLRLAYHGLRAKDKSFNGKFETDFDQTLPKINIVPQDIGRVVLNLINNAFYACTEKSKVQGATFLPLVKVSTKTAGDKIEISVKDNGPGIPEHIKEKIFQPFFTTKPTGQGTGLGLSLAYDIITKGHGGELKVESGEGEGSVFTITLPGT